MCVGVCVGVCACVSSLSGSLGKYLSLHGHSLSVARQYGHIVPLGNTCTVMPSEVVQRVTSE